MQRTLGGIGDPYDRPPGGRRPGGWWIVTEVEVEVGALFGDLGDEKA